MNAIAEVLHPITNMNDYTNIVRNIIFIISIEKSWHFDANFVMHFQFYHFVLPVHKTSYLMYFYTLLLLSLCIETL